MKTARRIPHAERVRRSSAMAEALGKLACHLGSARAQEEFGRWLALAATKAGPHATLRTAVEIMRLSGVSTLRVCGCDDKRKCRNHEREERVRAERVALHRSCKCGYKDRAARICAELHVKAARAEKDGHLEAADEYRAEIKINRAGRRAHKCD